jgi:23S rRNA (adenine2503-C2)-methyltransferase
MASRARDQDPDRLHPVARTPEEWKRWVEGIGERPFRAGQLFRWIHARGVLDPLAMTDLPLGLRERLATGPSLRVANVDERRDAADGTIKVALRLGDGSRVETVLIPALPPDVGRGEPLDADAAAADDGDEEESAEGAGIRKLTQCISTQVGCAMGCAFCATGAGGLVRHLSAEEIVAQVIEGRALAPSGTALRNVVVMGMGEPLHNYEALARALRLLTEPCGVALSRRRITVSTVGLPAAIGRLGRDFEGKIGLAVSLHAADDATRARLVPIARRWPLASLIKALRDYPLPRRRRVTIEYALVEGVNDRASDARGLAALLRGLRVKINLIPVNPVAHARFAPPARERVEAFQAVLAGAGYTCLIRRRRGDDIRAACGQLASRPRPALRRR